MNRYRAYHKSPVDREYRTNPLQSVDKAFTLIECFDHHHNSYSFNELVHKLNMSRGTIHRILLTAQKRGLIEQHPETGRYQLGMKLFELGRIVADQMEIRREAIPEMRRAAKLTGETLDLLIRSGDEALCIEKVHGQNAVKVMILEVGMRMPLNMGSGPKVLLASMRDDAIRIWLERQQARAWTDNSIVEPDQIWREISSIRQLGYAFGFEDVVSAAASVGAPVIKAGGEVIAAVSIVGASVNFEGKKREKLSKLVVEVGNAISAKL